MKVPFTIAAPAAVAASAYLSAKTQISHDLVLLGNLVTLKLLARYYESRDRVNFFYRLEEKAQDRKDAQRTFLIYQGKSWTFKEAYDLAVKYGTWLKTEHGIKSQDIVAMDFMNSPKMIFLTLGLWSIGAFPAYINYNLTSRPLLHCIRTSTAPVVFVDDEVKEKFSSEVTEALAGSGFREGGGSVEIVYIDAAVEDQISRVNGVREPDSARSGAGIQTGRKICGLIYTSGTTGMPKAALVGHHRAYAAALFDKRWMGLKKSDVYYTCMPLYHGTASIMAFIPALIIGYTLSLGHRFSNKTFWPDVRASGATVIQYVGETCRYLLAAPPLLDPVTGANLDKDNQVRLAFGNGLRPDVWEKFRNRFGIEAIAEFYAATEGPSALWNFSRNSYSSGAVGRAGLLLQLLARNRLAVVELDWETETPRRDPNNNNYCIRVPSNTPGELIYPLDPADIDASYQGYYGNKKATDSKIMRDVFAPGDVWFRTGDTLRLDEEGRFYFVDRVGDTFRWRSENVSTNEVSEALGMHPSIEEANVYGVEVPHHDGRAGCAAITFHGRQRPSRQVLRELASHASKTLPKFAVPVFLRVVKALDATGNNKQQKSGLRLDGIDPRKLREGEELYWLKKEGKEYEAFGDSDWERLRAGEIKL